MLLADLALRLKNLVKQIIELSKNIDVYKNVQLAVNCVHKYIYSNNITVATDSIHYFGFMIKYYLYV